MPIPELSLHDLLEETPTTSRYQQLGVTHKDKLNVSTEMNLVNVGRPKKGAVVQILENRRLAPIATTKANLIASAASSPAIRIIPSGGGTVTPNVKLVNKFAPQQLGMKPMVKISTPTSTVTTPTTTLKSLPNVTMTQIKTADGKVIYLQKTQTPTNTPSKLPTTMLTTTAASPPTAIATTTAPSNRVSTGASLGRRVVTTPSKPVVLPSGIQKAIMSKGITIAPTGLVKASTPTSAAISIKNIGPITTKINNSPAQPTVTTTTTPASGIVKKPQVVESPAAKLPVSKGTIQVVRTADGKIIKLNQSTSMLLSGAKPTGLINVSPTATSVATKTASPSNYVRTSSKLSPNNVVFTKKVSVSPSGSSHVVIKGPIKQLQSELASNKQTTLSIPAANTPTSVTTALPTGQMVVHSAPQNKQILVASKNIIKLSPKSSATVAVSNTTGTSTPTVSTNTPSSSSNSGMHAVQLPGKSGVHYVRVLPSNNNNSSKASSSLTSTPTTSTVSATVPSGGAKILNNLPQRLTLMRSSASPSTANTTIGSNTKFIMRQTSGSDSGNIVSRSTTLQMPKRTLGTFPVSATANKASGSSSSGVMEVSRKHKMTEVNMQQLKQLANDDNSDSGDPSPEAKKARYVLLMQKTKKQQLVTRSAGQRIAVQSTAPNSSSNDDNNSNNNASGTKKVYNLIKTNSSNGFKYVYSGATRAAGGAVRRPYTLVDGKPRLVTSTMRFKQLKALKQQQVMSQQQKHKQLQQQQLKQQKQLLQQQNSEGAAPELKSKTQEEIQTASGSKPVPSKNQFDVLKPSGSGAMASPSSNVIDVLGGLTSRRKHCNCSKSQCLKLYCDCFANGEFCQDCTCKDCFNNLEYEDERQRAIRSCLDRNPSAFKPKITARDHGDMRLHNKGCNCKRSGCLKNYCECYEAKIPCSSNCKCIGCRNMEDRPDVDLDKMDILGSSANSRQLKTENGTLQEVRTNIFLTDDVIEATIMCMISRIVLHEKQQLPIADTEREVIEELGESLNQIIRFAKEKCDNSVMEESKVD